MAPILRFLNSFAMIDCEPVYSYNQVVFSAALGFAGGAMLYVIFGELIPGAQNSGSGHAGTFGAVFGTISGILLLSVICYPPKSLFCDLVLYLKNFLLTVHAFYSNLILATITNTKNFIYLRQGHV